MSSKVYLKPNIVAQPLFKSWYAWAYLIAPSTAAMNVVGRHIKIMESYIQAPFIHAAACQNPAMTGGPFMDLGGKSVDEIKALLEATRKDQADLIDLEKAIRDLMSMLEEEAKGYSIESLYAKIPEELKGYVELVYDLENNASVRFIEPLLYHSKFYRPEDQSMAVSLIDSDDRPFVLSTPVLESEDKVHIQEPFESPAWDQFFKMESEAGDFDEICSALKIPEAKKSLFRGFFTDQAPNTYEAYDGPGARVRYFGHACISVETKNACILVDPVISYGYDAEVSRFTYSDLPECIDFVLITHNHQDHVLFESLLKLRHRIKNIVIPAGGGGNLQDPNLRLILQKAGFENIIELRELESLSIESIKITGIPFLGEHCDLDVRTKLAHLVEFDGSRILFAADSCNISPELYAHVHKLFGDIDVLFLGMECDGAPLSWLYGPLLPKELPREMDHSRRLAGSNYERGMDIVNRFNFKEVFVYAMGMEPWLKYIMAYNYTEESDPIIQSNKLMDECKQKGIRAERLFGEKEILYTTEKMAEAIG